MRCIAVLGVSLLACATPQPHEQEESVLAWWLTYEQAAANNRPLQLVLLSDSTVDASSSLARRLQARGLQMLPLDASPGPDTGLLRFTLPNRDSAGHYQIGVERLACQKGRLRGARSVVTLRCSVQSCREYREEPLVDGELELGACGRRP